MDPDTSEIASGLPFPWLELQAPQDRPTPMIGFGRRGTPVMRPVCQVVSRSLFVLVSVVGVWRVQWAKEQPLYWLLTFLCLPLLLEACVALRRTKGNASKWFSPAIVLFLLSFVPSLWLLELHHLDNKATDSKCKKLKSTEDIKPLIESKDGSLKAPEELLVSVCSETWVLAFHQALLVLLIVGRWMLPAGGGVSRDKLSQLLLVFVGTAGDILEFISETVKDIQDSDGHQSMVYVILAVWTWSLLQFTLHMSVLVPSSEDQSEGDGTLLPGRLKRAVCIMVEALLAQDVPFLAVRIAVMVRFKVLHQMIVFYSIKNFLVVVLNVYRLLVVLCEQNQNL